MFFIVLDSVLVLGRIMQFTSLGILDKQFICHAVCEPYVCMLLRFPHNVKSCLPQCTQGFITSELDKQTNNSFTLKSRLYLLKLENLP